MIDLMLGVLCEVRGPEHYDQHGGKDVDSAYHVAHGERPTCDGSDDKSSPSEPTSYQDSGLWERRDHAGFHCTWHGCG
jgi:hypothetical protein